MRRWELLGSAAILVVSCTASAANAQSANGSNQNQQAGADADQAAGREDAAPEIVVTGSRTISNGDAAPTPVTVLSSDQLGLTAPSNIANALASVPQFSGSIKPSSYVSSQMPLASFLNLRGLGDLNTPRTLVLLDGRRVNPATPTGQIDVNALPNLLVKRVDVVTGGASAAYGSDAIAGVVNYVLDRDFVGFKADLNAGLSSRGDAGSQRVSAAAGVKLLDDRLHLVGSLEYYNSSGIFGESDRKWAQRHCEPIRNPTWPQDGRSNFLLRCGVVGTDLAPGGVITSGPLRGIQFLPSGRTAPYQYGAELTAGATMVGGDGVWLSRGTIQAPLTTKSAFGHVDFEATDSLRFFAEGSFARSEGELSFVPPFFSGGTAFTIFADNPYLPSSVRTQMVSGALSSIRVGRAAEEWGRPFGTTRSDNLRGTLGFDYKSGKWIVNGYVDIGRTKIDQRTSGQLNKARAYEAADAVINPATGAIVCRSTLTNPLNGCVPLNVFGAGSASPAAMSYITGEAWTRSWSKQIAAELSVRGSPFSTWAGEVQIGAGADYRRISAAADADPISTSQVVAAPGSLGTPAALIGTFGGWLVGNQVSQPRASYDVKEAFGEIAIPLARELSWAHAADVNAAIRYADYSSTGGVTSWKLGLTYAPSADIRFRVTRSRDVRAPNLFELNQPRTPFLAPVVDPVTNTATTVTAYNQGNPNLKPEFGDTLTVGAVMTPRFIPRLSLAVDYYNIKLKGAVSQLAAQDILNLCAAGNAQYCQYIERLPAPANTILSITPLRQNLGALRAQGIDFEGNYRLSLGSGELSFRGLVSYLRRLTTIDAFGTRVEHAGVNGGEAVASPRWQGSASITYRNDRWTVFVQERFISGGLQNTNGIFSLGTPYTSGTGPNSLDLNHVKAVQYTDLTVQVRPAEHLELYATVNNLFDRDPPSAPTRTGVPITTLDTNPTLYDVVGRYFTVGARLRF